MRSHVCVQEPGGHLLKRRQHSPNHLAFQLFFFFFSPLPWVTISFQFNAGLNYSCQSPINPAAIQSLSREGGWGGEVPRRGESCLPPGPLIGPSSEHPRPPCTQADGLKRLPPPKRLLRRSWSGAGTGSNKRENKQFHFIVVVFQGQQLLVEQRGHTFSHCISTCPFVSGGLFHAGCFDLCQL